MGESHVAMSHDYVIYINRDDFNLAELLELARTMGEAYFTNGFRA